MANKLTDRMSAGTERRLADAVTAVADMTDEGMSPTDAVVKVATAYSLLPDQIALVATAYNTAAQATARKAAGVLDRARTVPLVDTAAAVRRAYTASPPAKTAAVRSQFVGPPTRTGPATVRSDAAAATVLLPTTKTAAAATSSLLVYKRAAAMAEDFRHRAERVYSRLTDKVAALADYFRRDPRVGFRDAWSESVLRHGKAAADLFAATQSMYPEVAAVEGSGSAYVRFDAPPHSLVSECMKLAAECVELTDQCGQMQAEADQLRPPAVPVSPVLRAKSAGIVGSGPGDTGVPGVPGGPGGGSGGGGGKPTIPSRPKPPESPTLLSRPMDWANAVHAQAVPPSPSAIESAQQKAVKALVDPYDLSQQRTVDAQMMLSDLMATDPTISQHHPSKVIAHYNEMSQLAPRLMTQAAAARAMLRQRLESGAGGIDPFQIEQLLKAENQMKERENPQYGKGILDV